MVDDLGPGPGGGLVALCGATERDGYAGNVDFQMSLYVVHLELAGDPASGLTQHDPAYALSTTPHGGQITVTGDLLWTAGRINSGSQATVPAYLNLAATATGLAEPTDGGTVGLGSKLTLMGDSGTETGSSLEVRDGTYNLTDKQAGFEVASFAALGFAVGGPAPKLYSDTKVTLNGVDEEVKAKISVAEGGAATIGMRPRPPGSPPVIAQPVLELKGGKPRIDNAGTLTVGDKTEVRFTPTGIQSAGPATGAGGGLIQDAASARTDLGAGTKVICGKETSVKIKQGSLVLAPTRTTGTPADENDDITIASPDGYSVTATTLEVFSGANLDRIADSHGTIRLVVTGNFRCAGWTRLYASSVTNHNDKIEASGWVDYTTGSELLVGWFAEDGTRRGVGEDWMLVKADWSGLEGGITFNGTLQDGRNSTSSYGFHLSERLNTERSQLLVKRVY